MNKVERKNPKIHRLVHHSTKLVTFVGGCADGDVFEIENWRRCWTVPNRVLMPLADMIERKTFPEGMGSEHHNYRREVIAVGDAQFHFFRWVGLSLGEAIKRLLDNYTAPL